MVVARKSSAEAGTRRGRPRARELQQELRVVGVDAVHREHRKARAVYSGPRVVRDVRVRGRLLWFEMMEEIGCWRDGMPHVATDDQIL